MFSWGWVFESRKKTLSVHQPIFVANIWKEKKGRGSSQRRLLMMISFQLALSTILILILGWPSPLISKWVESGREAEQMLGKGEKEKIRPEMRSWKMPEKSGWMKIFDRIRAENSGRMMTNKNPASEAETEYRLRKRSWFLPHSKASPLTITR